VISFFSCTHVYTIMGGHSSRQKSETFYIPTGKRDGETGDGARDDDVSLPTSGSSKIDISLSLDYKKKALQVHVRSCGNTNTCVVNLLKNGKQKTQTQHNKIEPVFEFMFKVQKKHLTSGTLHIKLSNQRMVRSARRPHWRFHAQDRRTTKPDRETGRDEIGWRQYFGAHFDQHIFKWFFLFVHACVRYYGWTSV